MDRTPNFTDKNFETECPHAVRMETVLLRKFCISPALIAMNQNCSQHVLHTSYKQEVWTTESS